VNNSDLKDTPIASLIRVGYSDFILEMNDDFYTHNYGSDRRGIPLGKGIYSKEN